MGFTRKDKTMSKKSVVVLVSLLLVAAFAYGSFLYRSIKATVQETGVTVSDEAGDSLVRSYSPILGPENAPVTLVEFFDPACEACRAFSPYVKGIVSRNFGQVKVVLRYVDFHSGSEDAARILEAARVQNVFEPVLDALYERQPEWASHGSSSNVEKILEVAGSAGLNIEQARSHMTSPEVDRVMVQDKADRTTLGIRQTPSFFLNGKMLTFSSPQELIALVGKEVEAARTAPLTP
jgi:protein-disulfide isomerase